MKRPSGRCSGNTAHPAPEREERDKERNVGPSRESVKPLGAHTTLGHLHELGKWKDIPYLNENDGMLPPFMIAVGSRVRVARAPAVLRLKDAHFIDEEARAKLGLGSYGRVSIVVGRMERGKFSVPVAVVETQMGCPATQINLREALYFSRHDGYSMEGRTLKSDGIYVIRAGTCAGVNSHARSELRIGIGDVLISTENYGSIGALIQSNLHQLNFTGVNVSEKVDSISSLIKELGSLRLSEDRMNLATSSSRRLVLQLQGSADRLGVRNFVGPNFTKDSLYAEIGEDGFAALRDNYGVISTEMEAPVLDVLAGEFRKAGIPVHSALISAAVGAIPGKSFPETREDQRAAASAEINAVRIAGDALCTIARSLNR